MTFAADCTLTVRDWQFVAKRLGGRTWEFAARRWASEHGAAIVLLANDALAIFSRTENGRVLRRTYYPRCEA